MVLGSYIGTTAPERSVDVLRARDAPRQRRPANEEMQPAAVTRRVLKDCAEHPFTIFPAASCLLAVAWTIVIAASPVSLMAAVVLGATSVISFAYNFVLKGPDRVRAKQAELMALRRQHDLYEVCRIGLECRRLGFDEGEKEAGELIVAYEKLAQYLESRESRSESFIQQAEDVYKQGGKTIHRALEMYKALKSVDVKTLRSELRSFKTKRSKLDDETAEAKTLDKQIAGHSRRLEQHQASTEELAELFAQVNEIEEALESTYLDLVQLGSRDPASYLSETGDAAHRLRSAVAARQRIDAKIRGVDEESKRAREKRQMYIRLAEQATGASEATGESSGFEAGIQRNAGRDADNSQIIDRETE